MKREKFLEIIKQKNLDFPIDWFSYNIPFFNTFLDKLKNTEDMLEIGSWEGMSGSYFILSLPKLKTITFIDPFFENSYKKFLTDLQLSSTLKNKHLNQYKRFTENINKCITDETVTIYKDFSENILPTLEKNKYDFIFIDGKHTTEQITIEVKYCYDLLKDNGYILFDDYDCLEVLKNTIDNLCQKYNLKIIKKYRQLLVQK